MDFKMPKTGSSQERGGYNTGSIFNLFRAVISRYVEGFRRGMMVTSPPIENAFAVHWTWKERNDDLQRKE